MKKTTDEKKPRSQGKPVSMYRYIFAIALAVLLVAGTWFWFNASSSKPLAVNLPADYDNDISPVGDGARLKLNDGTTILLLDSVNGVLATDGHGKTQVYKEAGWLSYRSGDMADSMYHNTLIVSPRSQYKVILPDGSRVWLNAGCILRYPVVFAGHERRVELTGEAYFEVAGLGGNEPGYTTPTVRTGNHNPFVITMRIPSGDVQLRTTTKARFNIMAYEHDPTIHISLLDGPSQLIYGDKKLDLKPGAQGLLDSKGQLSIINKDDREEALAWKDGMFRFRNTGIENVMQQVARWYGVNVMYKDTISQAFTGDIQRTVPIRQLLNTLAATGQVHFQIENDNITVVR